MTDPTADTFDHKLCTLWRIYTHVQLSFICAAYKRVRIFWRRCSFVILSAGS